MSLELNPAKRRRLGEPDSSPPSSNVLNDFEYHEEIIFTAPEFEYPTNVILDSPDVTIPTKSDSAAELVCFGTVCSSHFLHVEIKLTQVVDILHLLHRP